jgi:hypothetical protein
MIFTNIRVSSSFGTTLRTRSAGLKKKRKVNINLLRISKERRKLTHSESWQ